MYIVVKTDNNITIFIYTVKQSFGTIVSVFYPVTLGTLWESSTKMLCCEDNPDRTAFWHFNNVAVKLTYAVLLN